MAATNSAKGVSIASAPTADDGAFAGWAVGSLWLDSTTGYLYVCTDATVSAAVWKRVVDSEAAASGTSTALAATISSKVGKLTTEALTTAAGAAAAFVVTNTKVAAADVVTAQMIGGTSTTGTLEIKCVAAAGSVTITLTNRHASAAFNGTFIIGFVVHKA